MTVTEIILAVLLVLQTIRAHSLRRSVRFWVNHCTHWQFMFDREKYGVPYKMPENFNTETNPFKVEFEPQRWGDAKNTNRGIL